MSEEIKEFIDFIENYMPVSDVKATETTPALIIPEFTTEHWEYLKRTGDWRALKSQIDETISENKHS